MSEQDADNPGKEKRVVSISYPIKELNYFIDTFVLKMYTELGVSSYHTKEDIAKAMGLAVASIKQSLSTAQQYGLLEIKHGSGYKITPLFLKIHKPVNDEEKRQSIIESLMCCELYAKLIEDFKGHTVPAVGSISNILLRNYDLRESAANKAAEVFIDSLKAYNLIDSYNNLNIGPVNKTIKVVEKKEEIIEDKNEEEIKAPDKLPSTSGQPERPIVKTGLVEIQIPLKGSSRRAYLHIPEEHTPEDLKKIAKIVVALTED